MFRVVVRCFTIRFRVVVPFCTYGASGFKVVGAFRCNS